MYKSYNIQEISEICFFGIIEKQSKYMLKFFVPNLKKTNIMIVKHDLIGIYEILENDKLILISQADVVSYQYNHMKVKISIRYFF